MFTAARSSPVFAPAMRRAALLAGVVGALSSAACTTHRVDMVTSHDESIYLTTTKTTTYGPLGFLLTDEVEQSVNKCEEKETKAGKPLLKCLDVGVIIDGDSWDQ